MKFVERSGEWNTQGVECASSLHEGVLVLVMMNGYEIQIYIVRQGKK